MRQHVALEVSYQKHHTFVMIRSKLEELEPGA
jgi:hypothetical protein